MPRNATELHAANHRRKFLCIFTHMSGVFIEFQSFGILSMDCSNIIIIFKLIWTTFKQAMKRAIKQTTLAITMDSVCIWHQIYSMLIEFDYLRAEMMKRCDGIDDVLFDMRKGTPTKCIHFLVEDSHQKARSNSTWILLWIHSTILKWHVNSYFSEVSFTLPIVSDKPWNSHWKLSKVYLRS